MPLATCISFCSYDYRFLKKNIEEVSHFSDQVIVTASTHFFDGREENQELLEHCFAEHPNLLFVQFAYRPDTLYTPYRTSTPSDADWSLYWHSIARMTAVPFIRNEIDYVLFIDSDEIFEGKRFKERLATKNHLSYRALRLGCIPYGIIPSQRGKGLNQVLPILMRKSELRPLSMIQPGDRMGIFRSIDEPKWIDERPSYIHHYSWVRPRSELERKVASWGHRNDRNWKEILEKCFIEGSQPELYPELAEFSYETGPVYFDPLSIELPREYKKPVDRSHVLSLSPQSFLHYFIQQELENQ